jgi:peroxisomal 3,2-trans-enoyl-CoA isomerase
VVGLSAALVSCADFIYAAPHTFLLTPFSSLGLVTEGGASRALVQRLGIAKANEALIMSKRISCEELVAAGFVNKVFEECGEGEGEDEKFRGLVLREIEERLGEHLVGESLLGIKKLIRKPERDVMDAQNVAEVFGGLDRFVSGVPQEMFRQIATGAKKHKL